MGVFARGWTNAALPHRVAAILGLAMVAHQALQPRR